MTRKVKIFPDSSTGQPATYRGQIWWKSAVTKLPKGRLDYHTKTSGSAGFVIASILAKMGRSPPKFLDLSTYAEFGLDWLRFAGLIPERLIFRPKKSLPYRLSAYTISKQWIL